MVVQVKNHPGKPIRSFEDWEKYALPPERKERHWEEGRSACELGRIWTVSGEPAVPGELTRLLESNEDDANANALSHFLRLLLSATKADVGEDFELERGQMIGPILITDRSVEGPIKIPHHIPLFIGKTRTDLLG